MTVLALALALSLAPDPSEIDAIIDKATAAFDRKDWNGASRALADAYVLDPRPDLLYARAQAERLAGRCNVALPLYDRFIAEEKAGSQAAADAVVNRSICAKLVAGAQPQPAAAPAERRGGDAKHPAQPPWYRDPAGGVLVALGGVSTVIGGSVLGIALSRDKQADRAANEGSFVDRKQGARTQYQVGIAVLSIGGAMLIAGVVRWAVLGSKGARASGRTARVGVTMAPARRGAAVSLGLRF
ncbi:MAG: hypothetical protein IAG13_37605 [Deltaproteobacteria bacterium]|nr:hypothetical protein [Nannocystaceae bacterium]